MKGVGAMYVRVPELISDSIKISHRDKKERTVFLPAHFTIVVWLQHCS